MKETTFSTECLKAIAHLSKPMQDRIIADVTRYRLTGEMPEKMPAMRLALFKALIIMLDSEAEAKDIKVSKESKNLSDSKDLKVSKAPRGNITPLYIPTPATPGKVSRADRRRLQRAIS